MEIKEIMLTPIAAGLETGRVEMISIESDDDVYDNV